MNSYKSANIERYDHNPKICENCRVKIPYNQRRNRFCSSSCSASFLQTGKGRPHIRHTHTCDNCGDRRPTKLSRFCSKECETLHKRKAKNLSIEKGEVSSRPTLRKYLISIRGYGCEICLNTEWLGQPISIELDHIDGDAGNNFPENLRLLCPNCHSMTPTAKGRNRGGGRKSRGLPVN